MSEHDDSGDEILAIRVEPFDVSDSRRCESIPDVVAGLLAELRDARAELRCARNAQAEALDSAWIVVADALNRAIRASPGGGGLLEVARPFLAAGDVELRGGLGELFEELPEGHFEQFGTREVREGETDGTVIETWEPAILRGGRLMRPGKVIVARDEPPNMEGER